MKVKVLDQNGEEKGAVQLPDQFNEEIRTDLIKRAVSALQANARQPYGSFPEAGKQTSSYVSKRRRAYKATYGIGQSRTPRKVMSRNGSRMNWKGAFAPQTRGGRRSHPPKASKIWTQKINESENRKAIRSALSATMQIEIVKQRGHKVPSQFPFIISDDFQKIKKTSALRAALLKLGFGDEMNRVSERKVRAGKGKLRGRKYKIKKSVLFVTANDSDIMKSAANLIGVDVATVNQLNAELLAPGTHAGRLTLYTESAIKAIESQKLFSQNFILAEKKSKKKAE
jgi:large subunit ribosomal protein L4e